MAEKPKEDVARETRPMTIEIAFQCHQGGDVTKPMESYKARVHFASHEEMLAAAGESVKRILQNKHGRKNTFPQDRIVDVDAKGGYQKSFDEKSDEVLESMGDMTPEQFARFEKKMADMRAKMRI